MPTKKKKYNSRFPPARIKKIMQMDEEVGKVAAPVPVIISRALELFVETLLKKVNDVTQDRGARTVTPSHLKKCIHSETRFAFLKELVNDVPDLQGDRDDQPSTPSSASSSTSFVLPATSSSTSINTTGHHTSASSRSRGATRAKRPRKLSQDGVNGRSKPKTSKDDDVFCGSDSDPDPMSEEESSTPKSNTSPPVPAFTLTFPAFPDNTKNNQTFTISTPTSNATTNGKFSVLLENNSKGNQVSVIQNSVDEDYDI